MEINLSEREPSFGGTGRNLKMYCLVILLVCSKILHCLARNFFFPWPHITIFFLHFICLCLLTTPDSLPDKLVWVPGILVPSLDVRHHLNRTQLQYASNPLSWVLKFWLMKHWSCAPPFLWRNYSPFIIFSAFLSTSCGITLLALVVQQFLVFDCNKCSCAFTLL